MPNANGITAALAEIYDTTKRIFPGKVRSDSVKTECYNFVKNCWRFKKPAKDSIEELCDEDYLIERLTSPPLSLTPDDANDCLAAILEAGLAQRLDIHIWNGSQDKLLARPETIIALDKLRKSVTDVKISLDELRAIAERARVVAYEISVEALIERLYSVIDMKQQAKPQPKHFVLATFLLLGRMIGYSYALRLSKDERGHFVLQEKLIDALNKLGADLLGDRWTKDKQFVFDNFTRDLERRKTLLAFFEDSLGYVRESEGGAHRYRYYFKVENYEQDLPKLRFIVCKLIDGLCETGMTTEEVQRRLEGVREKYLFNFPIKGVDREHLQLCKPDVDPYSNVLAQAIKEATAEHLSYLESKTSTRQLSMDLG